MKTVVNRIFLTTSLWLPSGPWDQPVWVLRSCLGESYSWRGESLIIPQHDMMQSECCGMALYRQCFCVCCSKLLGGELKVM